MSSADRPAEAAQRVMLVDDNVDALESLEMLLQMLGFEVATAAHPEAALELAERFDPAIALIDIGLPGMDGYQLASESRRRRAGRPLRLVAFTGYGGADDVARAHAAGFDAHLVKPVDMDQLVAMLGA
ncbi:MAG: response regulator [Burkholderiaceae bacterium]